MFVCFLDVPTSNRPELFIQKLDQCNVIFDFRDPSMDIRSKEIKRSTLQELLEYISNNRNVIQPAMYPKIVNMVPPPHSLSLLFLAYYVVKFL